MILLVLFNFMRIFDNDFWGDEAYSIALIRMPFKDMIAETAADVNPPLYYILLRLVVFIFGYHGWAFHLASFIPYLVVMIFVSVSVRKRFGIDSAFVFMTLASVASTSYYYNIEVRTYSLAAAFVLFAYYYLLVVMEGKMKDCILFVVFSLGAAYCHYYALFAVSLFYLVLIVGAFSRRIEASRVILICTLTLAGYMPWLFHMFSAFRRTSEGFWMDSIPGVKSALSYFYQSEYGVFSIAMLGFTCITVLYSVYRHRDADSYWALWGIITSFGVMAAGYLISYLIIPSFTERYMYPVIPVLWLSFGVCISRLKHTHIITAVVILLILIVYIPEDIRTCIKDYRRNALCRETDERLHELIGEDDVILTDNDHLAWTILEYYLPGIENEYTEELSGYGNYQDSKHYWAVWSAELPEEEIEGLSEIGIIPEEKIADGEIGLSPVFLYDLKRE